MSEGLRIGLIADSHYPRLGGMEHEDHWLASALQKIPETSAAVACSAMPEVPRNFPYPYPVYRHRSLSVLTPWLSSRSARRMIEESHANILHGAMLHGGGFRAVRLGRHFGLPVAVRAHGADLQIVPEIGYGALLDQALAHRVRYALQRADFVSVPCSQLRQAAIDSGAAAERVRVVPPGIDLGAIDRIPFDDMRVRHRIAPADFLIVTVGRNRPIKRLNLLLDAIRILVDARPNIRCLCVGPQEDLPELIRRLGLDNIVVPIGLLRPAPAADGAAAGPSADLVNLYRAADAYVATSYRESFGLAALEALACGTPVIVTRGQGVEDVIKEGINGLVVDNQTSAGVAAGILKLMDMKAGLDRSRIRASVEHLSWAMTATHLREAYLELIACNPPRRQNDRD